MLKLSVNISYFARDPCVHTSMNLRKMKLKGVMLTLYGTRCVHTSMNLRKMKIS